MENEIQSVLALNPEFVISEVKKIPITVADLKKLCPDKHLNDELINNYLNLILTESKEKPNCPKVFTHYTYFYDKYREEGFEAVKRWTRTKNIFDFDIVLFPIHIPGHWALVSVDMRNKKISYLDSYYDGGKSVLKTILKYLKDVQEDKCVSVDLKTFELSVDTCEKQDNLSDCGSAQHSSHQIMKLNQKTKGVFNCLLLTNIITILGDNFSKYWANT